MRKLILTIVRACGRLLVSGKFIQRITCWCIYDVGV